MYRAYSRYLDGMKFIMKTVHMMVVHFSHVMGNNTVNQPTIGTFMDSVQGYTTAVSLKLEGLGSILKTILAKILS